MSDARSRPKRQVAFIRGINVGKAKRVPMAGLRETLAEQGFENVRTLLNSGNVVFDAPGTARSNAARIESLIAETFGVSARVLGHSAATLATIVGQNPLVEIATDPSRLMVVMWLDRKAPTALEPLLDRDWGRERLAVGSHAAYLWCPDTILASELHEAVASVLGAGATVRNWRTVLKVHDVAVQ